MAKFVLGVIPARGGSKGIKGKNIAKLGGLPLIAYTIKAASQSKLLGDFIVSTDSERIARVCRRFGASAPFLRPVSLAGGKTPMLPVLKHAVREYEKLSGKRVDIVVLLQPTSPFRTAGHIDQSVKFILDGKADSVFSVVPLEVSPKWLMKIDGGRLKFAFGRDFNNTARQEMGGYYRMHGLIKAFTRDTLMKAKKYAFGKKALPLVTSKKAAVEIDEPEDLEIARALLRKK